MLMMPSCKEVSKLLSDRLDQRLGFMESLGLRLHLAMCDACSQVSRQFELLRRGVAELPKIQDPKGSGEKS
jgi:predicted anti-sigma-YlaC factor YlaD